MAGRIRQPIDIKSLETYLNANVPEIKTPLDVKQVCVPPSIASNHYFTNQSITVRLWTKQPDLSAEITRR